MRQFGTLVGYELKKICSRKSTWFTLLGLVLFYTLSELLTWTFTMESTYTVTEAGEVKQKEWNYTFGEMRKRERAYGLSWSGRAIDDALLQERGDEYNAWLASGQDSRELERFEALDTVLANMTGRYPENIAQIYEDGSVLTLDELYEWNDSIVQMKLAKNSLTKKELSYWAEKKDSLKKPFTFQYASGFSYLVYGEGMMMAVMFSGFVIAVAISQVFAVEHQRRTDQLILTSRLGRKQMYFAKILAGTVFTIACTSFFVGMVVLVNFLEFGAEGFHAAVQLTIGWYPYPLAIGQIVLIMTGIALLSCLLVSIFTMVISEKFRSSIIGMAVAVAVLFVPAFVSVPKAYRALTMFWDCLPLAMTTIEGGFGEFQLVPFFGMQLTSWQFAPILYIVLGIALIFLGKRVYCRYQVQGR